MGGGFILGATDEPWAYDNELGSHEVELGPFFIVVCPSRTRPSRTSSPRVCRSQKHWSEEGWEWRERENVTAPLFWERRQHGWERVRFGRREPVPPDEPVQHVSWYERTRSRVGPISASRPKRRWGGQRHGTSAGARTASRGDASRRDEANLGHRRFSRHPWARTSAASPVGCRQLIGDVWGGPRRTSSRIPGSSPIRIRSTRRSTSARYRVLRGGSWATDSSSPATFRNFDFPDRRHIFAGFRCCARDA